MLQQSHRPDSPSEQFAMYAEFEPERKSTLNGYHRSSFTSIPNATRPSKHLATPSSTLPSTNPTIYRDVAPLHYQHDPYAVSSPTHAFLEPSRPSFSTQFGLNDPYASYNKPPVSSQLLSLPHAVNSHPVSMSSQTPYGPHLATNGLPMAGNTGHAGASNITNSNSQEDISTIFVVGFPDDMQEREFQNMFTFCAGFEAATLKIPNKEYTAYGISSTTNNPPAPTAPGLQNINPSHAITRVQAQAAMNDPYNLVTLNQGGVVVDGGRDGTMTSWPTAPMDDSYYPPGFLGGLVPGVGGPPSTVTLGPTPNPSATGPAAPRKQIIGFAKFRTREAAMEARDVLQGRRVDIEKGSVLKAEMAKKNLHTKRGVTANGSTNINIGPVSSAPGAPVAPGTLNPPSNTGIGFGGHPVPSQFDKFSLAPAASVDIAGGMSARERELGTLGAMGFLSAATSNASGSSSGATAVLLSSSQISRFWDDEVPEQERRFMDESMAPIGTTEGNRRQSEFRDERQSLRLDSGSAFEAFHSIPAFGPLVSPPPIKSRPLTLSSLNYDEVAPGPWDHFSGVVSNPPSSARASQSSNSRSSPASSVTGSSPSKDASRDDEDVHTNPETELQDPNATAKEIDITRITRAIGNGAVSNTHSNEAFSGPDVMNGSTSQGNTSPQLPSPSSGSGTSVSTHSGGVSGSAILSSASSSSSLRHGPVSQHCPPSNFPSQGNPSMLSAMLPGLVSGVDQNPPINTLYVGNLPISPPPLGCPPDILEESLRDLFRSRPGFRRLSFKQKNTGPMCFVEFEDVNAATKTINELYGNTLNGLVKGGGIRLSYSKNPLGVRTPTSANGPGPNLQHPHLQHQQGITGREDRERGDKFGFGIQALSPIPHHHHSSNHRLSHPHEYMISPPPPRFAGASSGSNMSFGNFSSSFRPIGSAHISTGSGSSNYMFGTPNSFQGGGGFHTDAFGDAQGQALNPAFSPFDSHLDHPQMPQMSLPMPQNSNQNQNL
ncbi:hypothetical protein D9757_001202 [Collybiopsis confluens]|uniref:RRM domain-containing protein n=1 Tax=Collybiopsis confluens TaxID=2823264 RepID=A0A8H5MGP2_9AGAR|nr:hypothetical protein D9757_001202 [Collybiopsis confluens]